MALVPKKPLRPHPPSAATISTSYLDSFIAYTAGECHLAENTVAAYRRDTRRFFQWLEARPVTALSIRDLADYVNWLHERKLSPTSIARHIASLKVFFRYLQLEGVLVESQAELLGSQKLWERVPKVLSPAQVNRLFEMPKPGDLCWRRDRALLELLYATGCRASEISNLKLHDLHWRKATRSAAARATSSGWCRWAAGPSQPCGPMWNTSEGNWRRRFRRRRSGSCSPIAAAVCGGSGSGS